MEKEELKSLCRYYKGENECSFHDGNKALFWSCEKWWTEQTALANDEASERIAVFIKDYMEAGLSGFEKYDSVPITLKAVIFNRYCKLTDRVDIEGFKRLYIGEYKKEG